jgi:transposase
MATQLKLSLMPSRETSRQNLERAKANWRKPRPWRSPPESLIVRLLVWQWYTGQGPKCSGRAISRRVGVSHAYVQKLVREFEANPSEIQRQQQTHGETTFQRVRETQEQTQQMRVRGELRSPRRWKIVEFELGGYVERAVVPIKATIPVPPRIIDCASCHARLLEKEWLSHACPMRPLEEQDLRALANATKGRAQKTWADLVDWDRV